MRQAGLSNLNPPQYYCHLGDNDDGRVTVGHCTHMTQVSSDQVTVLAAVDCSGAADALEQDVRMHLENASLYLSILASGLIIA